MLTCNPAWRLTENFYKVPSDLLSQSFQMTLSDGSTATKPPHPFLLTSGAPATGSRLRATRRPNFWLSPPPCLALALSFFTPSFFPLPFFCLKLRRIPSLSLCHLPHLLPMPFSQISWVSVLSSASWMNIVSFFLFFGSIRVHCSSSRQ